MANVNRNILVRELLEVTDEAFDDEALIHQLIDERITVRTDDDTLSFGQRAADAVAKFAGSWAFIFSFLGVMGVWMALNVLLALRAFDAYPFILLNLLLSCLAAIQAPLIMMSQNRRETKDRARAENDYRINLKNELVIDDLHVKLDQIIENQAQLTRLLDEARRRDPQA